MVDQVLVPTAPPEPKKSFLDMVMTLVQADDGLADPDFDPVKLVGDLRDKVDGIQTVLTRMQSVIIWLGDLAKPLVRKAQAIKNNRDRLEAYVVESMRAGNFQTIPGNTWKANLRDSPVAMTMLRAATAEDYERFPGLVKMERSYAWETVKIKEQALAGTLPIQEVLGKGISAEQLAIASNEELAAIMPAKLTQGNWVEFKPCIPESLESKKKPKKAKDPK